MLNDLDTINFDAVAVPDKKRSNEEDKEVDGENEVEREWEDPWHDDEGAHEERCEQHGVCRWAVLPCLSLVFGVLVFWVLYTTQYTVLVVYQYF